MVATAMPIHTLPPDLMSFQEAVRPTPVKKMSMNHSFSTATSKSTCRTLLARRMPSTMLTNRPATTTPGTQ